MSTTDDFDPRDFHSVIDQVMPLIYEQLLEEAATSGNDSAAPLDRFASHEHYQFARQSVLSLLTRMGADAQVTEFVLNRVLPEHRPVLH